MKFLFYILLIFIVVIFLPIPIKISLYFNKNGYDIKLYRFSLVKKFKKNLSKNDKKDIKKSHAKKKVKAKKKSKDEDEKFNLFKFLKARIDASILYRNFKLSHFKPRLRVNGFLNYSLGDPMNTALSYGTINMVLPFFYRGILLFFKAKKFKFDINPLLESESHINTKLDCIIFFSIAHIIYMLFLIFKSILDTREVNPL